MFKDNQIIKLIRSTKPSKTIMFAALFFALVGTVAGLVVPLLTRDVIDGSLANFTISKGLFVAFIFLIQGVTSGLAYFLLGYLGNNMVANIREQLWKKIIYLPIPFFSSSMSGETASRIVNDTNVLKELVSEKVINFIVGIITLISSVAILFVMDWKMTAIILVAVPITALVVVPLGKMMFSVATKTQNKMAELMGDITQSLGEMKLVKSSNAENDEVIKETKSIRRLLKLGIRETGINAVLDPLITGVVMLVLFGIIAYGGMRVASGTLTSGTLIAFVLYLFQIVMPIAMFGQFFTQFQKAKGATQRIVEILDEIPEDLDKGQDIDLKNKVISFEKVSFNYNDDNDILKDITFKAMPNETIAFAGPSGSGKSTTFALLERFYNPDSGTIYLDDMDVKDISLRSWRSQIGYVPQESSLFSTSIRENLTYGLDEDISDEELWQVVELACAKELIEKLPQGFDTEIGERGMKLSGGERQRIAIARAFLRDPKVLLLDEATASLDSSSEKIVQEALTNLMKDRTTFVIAHRLSTIVDANQIVFIDGGKVTGIGTHQELVNNHELYASFAKQQLSD